jgi:hypothetical protein
LIRSPRDSRGSKTKAAGRAGHRQAAKRMEGRTSATSAR